VLLLFPSPTHRDAHCQDMCARYEAMDQHQDGVISSHPRAAVIKGDSLSGTLTHILHTHNSPCMILDAYFP
jgi:hypothetical protein